MHVLFIKSERFSDKTLLVAGVVIISHFSFTFSCMWVEIIVYICKRRCYQQVCRYKGEEIYNLLIIFN